MKKVSKLFLSLLIVLTLVLAFSSCDNFKPDDETPPDDPNQGVETPDEGEKDETTEEVPEDKPEEDPVLIVESVTLDQTELTIGINTTYALVATVLPDTALNKELTWESSDDSVVLVSDGVVCAITKGEATVTAKAENGVSATCHVTVIIPEDHVCTPGAAVVENEVAVTCLSDGSYDLVVYCSVCKEEVSRENKIVYTEGHNYIEAKCEFCDDVRVSSVGLNFTLNDDGESYTLTSYGSCTDKNVVVTTYEDKPVTAIADKAFQGKPIVGVVIGNSVTSIGKNVFQNCTSLASVKLPQNITEISNYLFDGCTKLTKVSIPQAVTAIGMYSFQKCESIENILIPASVTSVGDYAFSGCASLQSLVVSDGVSEVGNSAFSGCISLKSIVVPDSVNTLGQSAFSGCKALENISLGKQLSSIGNSAFYGCAESLLTLSVSTENTVYSSYKNCLIDTANKKLILGCKNSEIPADGSVLAIASNAFLNAKQLESIFITAGVTTIESDAFYGCDNLKVVTFGKDVNSIHYQAFPRTPLETLIVDSANNKYHSVRNCVVVTNDKELIMGCKNSVIPTNGSVTSIGAYAFYDCDSITSLIEIPEKVSGIGSYAFSSCDGLTEVVIPNGIVDIASCAFSGCSNLVNVVVSNNVKTIGEYAFLNCNIKSVTIGEDVQSIGGQAFRNNRSLATINFNATAMNDCEKGGVFTVYGTNSNVRPSNKVIVYIGANVTVIPSYLFGQGSSGSDYKSQVFAVVFAENSVCETIGKYAFYSCDKLENISIPNSVTTISDCAFLNCSSLVNIVLGDGVTSIGERAFSSCSKLESVVIGDSTISIGPSAFSYCSGLTSVEIGDGVTSIGSGAFTRCSKLTSIVVSERNTTYKTVDDNLYTTDGKTLLRYSVGKEEETYEILDGVETIDSYAFNDCDNLTEIVIPDSVKSIGSYAFYCCDNLTSIVIPNSVTSIGSSAFDNCTNLTSIVIPHSVTSIGSAAFFSCSKLKDVYYTGTEAEWKAISISSYNNTRLTSATKHYNYTPEN